jgi:hypothetical protein
MAEGAGWAQGLGVRARFRRGERGSVGKWEWVSVGRETEMEVQGKSLRDRRSHGPTDLRTLSLFFQWTFFLSWKNQFSSLFEEGERRGGVRAR